MRVIAGAYRGRTLKAVGTKGTRPTTDRVREAWASTIENLREDGFNAAIVLDPFAGSGALGIEALSRGASQVVFCEKNPNAYRVLKENLDILYPEMHQLIEACNLDSLAPQVISQLVCKGPFDVIILDPPYSVSFKVITHFLESLSSSGGLLPGCIVSYEHATVSRLAEDEINLLLEGVLLQAGYSFSIERRKTYGTISLDYFRYDAR